MEHGKANSEQELRQSLITSLENADLSISDLQSIKCGSVSELNELLTDLGFGSIQRAHIRKHLQKWAEEEDAVAAAEVPATEAAEAKEAEEKAAAEAAAKKAAEEADKAAAEAVAKKEAEEEAAALVAQEKAEAEAVAKKAAEEKAEAEAAEAARKKAEEEENAAIAALWQEATSEAAAKKAAELLAAAEAKARKEAEMKAVAEAAAKKANSVNDVERRVSEAQEAAKIADALDALAAEMAETAEHLSKAEKTSKEPGGEENDKELAVAEDGAVDTELRMAAAAMRMAAAAEEFEETADVEVEPVEMQSFDVGIKNMDEDGETDELLKHIHWNMGLGIDLGSRTIRAASWIGSEVTPVFGPVPCCIHIEETGKVLFGDEAYAFPCSPVLLLAQCGQSGVYFDVGGQRRFFFLAELLALLLCWVRQRAEEKSGQTFKSLSLSTHACFGLAKRRILHEATVLAGFERTRLLRAPVSGALWLYLNEAGVEVVFYGDLDIRERFAFGATVGRVKEWVRYRLQLFGNLLVALCASDGNTVLEDDNATLLSLGACSECPFAVNVIQETAPAKPLKTKAAKRKKAASKASASSSERQAILIDCGLGSIDCAHVVVEGGIFEVRWAGGDIWNADGDTSEESMMHQRLTKCLRSLMEQGECWDHFGRENRQVDDVIFISHGMGEVDVQQVANILKNLGLDRPITSPSWFDFRHIHACGAAMQGAILGTGHQSGPLQNLMLIDSSAQAIGFGSNASDIVWVVDAHVPIPTTKSVALEMHETTSLSILNIYEKVEGAGVNSLGFIRLPRHQAGAGQPLTVVFEVGTAGQVKVHTGLQPPLPPGTWISKTGLETDSFGKARSVWCPHDWLETRSDNLTVSDMLNFFRVIMSHKKSGWVNYGERPQIQLLQRPCHAWASLPTAKYVVCTECDDEDGLPKLKKNNMEQFDKPWTPGMVLRMEWSSSSNVGVHGAVPSTEKLNGIPSTDDCPGAFTPPLTPSREGTPPRPRPERAPPQVAQGPASSQLHLKDRRGQKLAEALRQKLDKKKQMQKSATSEGPEVEEAGSEGAHANAAAASEHDNPDGGNVCAVCLCTEEELGKTFTFVLQKCGHKCICKPCLRKMKSKKKQVEIECPLCRTRSKPVLAEKYGGNVFTAQFG